MDLTIMGIFIVIAFVAGAYVRKPWTIGISRHKDIPHITDTKTEEKKLNKFAQLANLLEYTGQRKDDED